MLTDDTTKKYSRSPSLHRSVILRELAGVSPKMIKPWMDEHQEELESYRNAQGHTYRQNSDKPGPRSVMKWSEAAYGEYQWLK